MSHGKPKTQDLEWLVFSLQAFNGSGYADMNSPEDFLESYVAYKKMKNKPDAVMLAERHKQNVLPMIEQLLAKTHGASRKPAQKYLDKLQAFRNSKALPNKPEQYRFL